MEHLVICHQLAAPAVAAHDSGSWSSPSPTTEFASAVLSPRRPLQICRHMRNNNIHPRVTVQAPTQQQEVAQPIMSFRIAAKLQKASAQVQIRKPEAQT